MIGASRAVNCSLSGAPLTTVHRLAVALSARALATATGFVLIVFPLYHLSPQSPISPSLRLTRVHARASPTLAVAGERVAVLSTAKDLKHTREIKRLLANEWSEPSDEFVRYIAGQV